MTWPCTTALPYNYGVATVAAGTFACLDWTHGIADILTAGPKLHRFDILSRLETSVTDLSTFPFVPAQQVVCAGETSGRVYFGTNDAAHLIVGFNPSINNYDKTFNASAGGVPAPGYISSFTDVDEYCIMASLNAGASGAVITLVDMTGGANPGFVLQFNTVEVPGIAGPGNARIAGAGNFAVASALDSNSVPQFIGFYTINKLAHSRVGQVIPSDLDGVNTAFTSYFRVGADRSSTPGMLQCASTAAGNYLFKVSLTGVLLWKLAIHNGVDLEDAKVIAGKLFFIAPGAAPFEFYVIDTIAGAILQHTVGVSLQNFLGKGASTDQYQLLIDCPGQSPGPFNWETFGPPPPPPITQGGVIRLGC